MHEQPVSANPGRHIPVQIGASTRPSVQASYAERLQLQSLMQRWVDVVFGAKAAEEAGWELPHLDSIVDVRPRETCGFFFFIPVQFTLTTMSNGFGLLPAAATPSLPPNTLHAPP